ncbi:MAG: sigma 54-interacting transcriptional regulator [bacterium]
MRKFLKRTIKIVSPLVVLLIILILAELIHLKFEEYVFFQFQDQQLAIAKNTAKSLGTLFEEIKKCSLMLAELAFIEDEDNLALKEPDHIYQIYSEIINAIYRIDKNGDIIFKFPKEAELLDYELIKRIIDNHREDYSAAFHIYEYRGGIILTVAPIYKDMRLDSLIIIEINIHQIAHNYVNDIDTEEGSFGLILNERNEIIFHTSAYKDSKLNVSDVMKIVDEGYAATGKKKLRYFFDIHGSLEEFQIVRSSFFVGDYKWKIFYAIPYNLIADPIKAVHKYILLLLAAVVILFTSATIVISNMNKRRIRYEEERKHIKEALKLENKIKESEERLRAIIESIGSDRIVIIDRELHISWANKLALEESGDIIGKSYYDIYKLAQTTQKPFFIQKTFEDGKVHFSEEYIQYEDKTNWFLSSSSPIMGINNEVNAVVVTAKNITELKRLEIEIKESKHLLDKIMENMNDGIRVIDSKYTICFMNTRLIEKFGNQVGKKCYKIFKDTNNPCQFCELSALLEKRKSSFNLIQSDINQGLIEISASLIKSDKGEQSIIEVLRDITERKELEDRLHKSEELRAKELMERYRFGNIIGKSPSMQKIYDLIEVVAQSKTSVLLQGETGTGKELIARAIHYNSPFKEKPFVELCCSVLSENLLESELFGHVRGAFTGAIKDKIGRFEMANGGTILLDEIGEISPSVQVKLLRVLQEREFIPVGGGKPIKVDLRIIAATNKDLKKAVEQGEFREDLYYRLNVVPIHIPPLRERKEDIPFLARHFLEKFKKIFNKKIKAFSPQTLDCLLHYNWPGNIRQLENAIEHACVKCGGEIIIRENLPEEILAGNTTMNDKSGEVIKNDKNENKTSLEKAPDRHLKDIEVNELVKVLEETDWNISKTAKILGIGRATVYRKISKYNLKAKLN